MQVHTLLKVLSPSTTATEMPGACQCAKVSATSLSKSGVNGEVSCMLNGISKAADKAEQQEKKLLKISNIITVV